MKPEKKFMIPKTDGVVKKFIKAVQRNKPFSLNRLLRAGKEEDDVIVAGTP